MADTPTTKPKIRAARPAVRTVGAPAAFAEVARVVGEDAAVAVVRTQEAIASKLPRLETTNDAATSTVSMKGLLDMATTFDTTAFTPTPEKFQALFGDFQTRAKTGLEKGAKIVEELGELTRGNVEAFVESGRAAAKGAETIGQDAASYGRKSLEEATAAFKSFAAAKSPTELFKLQSDYAKSSFEAVIAEGSRLSETWLKLAGEIAQPLSTRVAVAADKIKAPLA